jgi:RNA recognition motif-containing protein
MANEVYVGNLSFSTNEDRLREVFSQYGTVESANIINDRDTGRSRGFGFVKMSTAEEAKAAIAALEGKEVDGRQLKVNEAKQRESSGGGPRRGGGGGGSRGGGYNKDRY